MGEAALGVNHGSTGFQPVPCTPIESGCHHCPLTPTLPRNGGEGESAEAALINHETAPRADEQVVRRGLLIRRSGRGPTRSLACRLFLRGHRPALIHQGRPLAAPRLRRAANRSKHIVTPVVREHCGLALSSGFETCRPSPVRGSTHHIRQSGPITLARLSK
jgi:hypothetical protein